MSRKKYLGVLYASVAAVLWGVLAVTLKMTGSFLPSIDVVWFRMTMSFFTLFMYYLIFQPSGLKIIIKPPLLLLLAGLFLGLNYIGYMEGIHFTTPANAQIFVQSGPLLLAVAGIFFFKERLNGWQIAGFLAAIAGFAFYYYDQSLFAVKTTYARGIILVLLSGIAWAIYAAMQKKLVSTISGQKTNMIIYLCSALMFFPFIRFSHFANLTTFQWGVLIFTYLNTLISYGAISMALKYLEANKVSSIVILNPILTFAFIAFLQFFNIQWVKPEQFSWISVAGALLVLAGALAVLLINPKKDIRE
jgi:drug/metabolite transporter (DMT)-like permease